MRSFHKVFSLIILIIFILILASCGLTAKKTGSKKSSPVATAPQTFYTLTVKVNNSNGGVVHGSPASAQYPAGTRVVLEADDSSNWLFDKWTGDYYTEGHPAREKDLIALIMDKDKEVMARFIPGSSSLLLYTCSLEVDQSCVGMGKVIKKPDEYEYVKNSPIKLTAVANDGYEFEKWVGTGIDLTNEKKNPLYIKKIQNNLDIKATFKVKE